MDSVGTSILRCWMQDLIHEGWDGLGDEGSNSFSTQGLERRGECRGKIVANGVGLSSSTQSSRVEFDFND